MEPNLEYLKAEAKKIAANEFPENEKIYDGDLIVCLYFVINTPCKNPYHNLFHTLYVFCMTYEACKAHKGHLSSLQVRNLLIAALFHDFGHTGVGSPDSTNIEKAVAGFNSYILTKDEFGDIFETGEIEILIRATEYPHPEITNISLGVQILRDIDVSQVCLESWYDKCFLALQNESAIDRATMVERQLKFLKNLRFSTKWAQEKFGPTILVRTEQTEALIST